MTENTPSTLPLTAPAETSDALRRDLRARLLSLNFHAFARCMALVIEKMGGEDVRLAGRQNWRGRNRHGGYDLEATLPDGFGKRRAIVQVKQFDAVAIYQRGIDELRGTCLRVGASEALLITTGIFAPSVDRSLLRLQESTVAPVRLIDGEALLDLMILHRVGVWEEPGSGENEATQQGLDTDFFEDVAARAQEGNSRLDPLGEPRFLVSVQVRPFRQRTRSASQSGTRHETLLTGSTSGRGSLEVRARC